MDAFDQVWETSRHNSWSWGYPAAIWLGCAVLVVLSLVRASFTRRALKAVTIVAFGLAATWYSAGAIQEKWRIRGEWADNHVDRMTDAQRHAMTVDGANLTLGHLIEGFHATVILTGAASLLFLARKFVVRLSKSTASFGVADNHMADRPLDRID